MKEDLKKLVEQSKDTTFLIGAGRRRDAVKKLGQIGSPEVVAHLINALRDEDTQVQEFAKEGLSNLKDPAAIEKLLDRFVRSKKKSLWTIIKAHHIPEDLAERLAFLVKAHKTSEIKNSVTEANFDEVLDLIIESNIENMFEVLKVIIESAGPNAEMTIIRKFLATKNDALFQLIDYKEWYPPSLDKKIMFLLKTEKFQKIADLLDGTEFREILDILTDPKFPMKKAAADSLSAITNPIIKDEICQVYMREDVAHFGPFILKNNWSPNPPRDKIFFYLKTDFLKGFFNSTNIDPMLLGGYLDVPHVRESIKDEELEPFAMMLDDVAKSLGEGERPDIAIARDSKFEDMKRRLHEYLDHPKSDKVIKEICDDYLETGSPFLSYLIKQMGWAPEDPGFAVPFYIQSDQEKKIYKLSGNAIKPLYDLMKGKNKKLAAKAEEILKKFRNPKAVDQVFQTYFATMDKQLEEIIKENNWKPHNKKEKALFFLFSEQPERYTEVEEEGFSVLMEAYQESDTMQRMKIVELILMQKAEYFTDFLLSLLTYEKSSKVLRMLVQMIPIFFKKIHDQLFEMLRMLEGYVLKLIVKILAELKTEEAMKMLFDLAKMKMGWTAFWILKFFEEFRWQPEEAHEKALLYEMYRIRDDMLRIIQNKVVDPDPAVRRIAALTFTDFSDERQLPTLMKYVEDPSDDVREGIAYSLGRLCALSPRTALQNMDTFRISSIYMLFSDVRKAFAMTADVDQVSILGRNYKVGTKTLRVFTIAAFEEMQKKESVPYLLEGLKDEDFIIKRSAMHGLREIAYPNEEIEEALFRFLEDNNEELRLIAAETLGSIMSEHRAEKVLNVYESGEYGHADSYLLALAKSNPLKYRNLLETSVMRPDISFEGKSAAITAMGMIGDEDAAVFLVGSLKKARMTAEDDSLIPYVKALGMIGHPVAYQELASIKSSAGWDLRREIVKTMSHIKDRIALVEIIRSLEDTNGWVQIEALRALGRYYNQFFKFKETEKDLKFVGAIIGRLKKFTLNPVQDMMSEQYQYESELAVLLLKHRLTRLYLLNKPRILSGSNE